jgi:hypothetical protein
MVDERKRHRPAQEDGDQSWDRPSRPISRNAAPVGYRGKPGVRHSQDRVTHPTVNRSDHTDHRDRRRDRIIAAVRLRLIGEA